MRDCSPVIQGLLDQLHETWGRMRSAEEPEERAFARLLDDEDRLLRRLAEEPNLSPSDRAAKLDLLCLRLRGALDLTAAPHVTTYLLAESVRDG